MRYNSAFLVSSEELTQWLNTGAENGYVLRFLVAGEMDNKHGVWAIIERVDEQEDTGQFSVVEFGDLITEKEVGKTLFTALNKAGINSFTALSNHTVFDVRAIPGGGQRNIGNTSIRVLRQCLQRRGLNFKGPRA